MRNASELTRFQQLVLAALGVAYLGCIAEYIITQRIPWLYWLGATALAIIAAKAIWGVARGHRVTTSQYRLINILGRLSAILFAITKWIIWMLLDALTARGHSHDDHSGGMFDESWRHHHTDWRKIDPTAASQHPAAYEMMRSCEYND